MKIVITGYPKSGNTWLTRLTAELIQCPVIGFWQYDVDEIAIEGLQRISTYQCYKSHHDYHELAQGIEKPDYIICIIRDPKDVAVSAYHFFQHIRKRVFQGNHVIARALNKILYNVLYRKKAYDFVIQAILKGDPSLHYWCRRSWLDYYATFKNQPVLWISYEALIDNPMEQSKKILHYIGLERNEVEIKSAIDNQSIHQKKKNTSNPQNILRKGVKGEWKKELSDNQIKAFNEMQKELNQRL